MLPAPSLLLLSVCLQTAQPTNNASQPNIIWLDRMKGHVTRSLIDIVEVRRIDIDRSTN